MSFLSVSNPKLMYVCICKQVTDRAIVESVRNGAACLSDVQKQLGVASRCGSCAQLAQEIIDDAQNQNLNFLPYAVA
jgi:bacterioferritin-associated ferredoxin